MENTSTKELRVTITNAFTGLVGYITIKGNLGMSIEECFEICKKFHPDSFINFYWNDGKDFIFGQPLNMKKDEELLDNGKMQMDEYMCKWYPQIAGNSGECV